MFRGSWLVIGLSFCCASCLFLGPLPPATPPRPPVSIQQSSHAFRQDSARPGSTATPEQPSSASADPASIAARLLAMVNDARERAGLKPLVASPYLDAAARRHTIAMVRDGSFAHRVPGETGLAERLGAAGVHSAALGENIFETSSDDVARECVEAWLESPGHRENLMSAQFRLTGVGIARNDLGDSYVTEDFAH
jgi:uncharacterized protein YkwD